MLVPVLKIEYSRKLVYKHGVVPAVRRREWIQVEGKPRAVNRNTHLHEVNKVHHVK